MKQIKISGQQLSKLEEMFKYLFPGYEWVRHNCQLDELSNEEIGVRNRATGLLEVIPVFEFCMTYLPVEMFRWLLRTDQVNKNIAVDLVLNRNLLRYVDFDRYEINPVEYLYELFNTAKK